ncbi:MAG: hypothetical protein IPH12_12615 [Saprospirales bacterium]|nr:hypothetical protein [Saprospirales bacterium]
MKKVRTKSKGPSDGGSFDYDEFEKEAISRLKEGAGLVGSEGVLTGLIQRLVNAALSGEMSAHLKEERALGPRTVATGTRRRNWIRSWGLLRSARLGPRWAF